MEIYLHHFKCLFEINENKYRIDYADVVTSLSNSGKCHTFLSGLSRNIVRSPKTNLY